MSHPERLDSSGGGPADTIAQSSNDNGSGGESLAEFAVRHGLSHSAARPSLGEYIRQLWQRRQFVWMFASSKSFSKYTEARLGQLWQVLTPLLNAAVYYFIFGLLLGRDGDVTNYIPFLVTGVFVFTFTTRSVNAGAKSIGTNLSLIRALHFPRACLPFAYTIVELQQLFVALGVLSVIILSLGEPLTWHWLLLVPAVLLQVVFNIGLSLIVARMGAFVRDITQLLPFILRTWLYASGIIFAIGFIKQKFVEKPWLGILLDLNPGSVYVELSRVALLASYRNDLTERFDYPPDHISHLWWYAIAWAIIALVGGFWFFYHAEERYGRG